MLKEKMDALGIECVIQSKDDDTDPQAMFQFLFKHLLPKPAN